ncbi:MAG: hypothetical protein JKY65_24290 [Planctomycetes bacterium]|nr:hypothetical protein [Planctomycetota bacterium]
MKTKASCLAAFFLVATLGAVGNADQRGLPPLDNPHQEGVEVTDWLTLKPYVRFAATPTTNLFLESHRRVSTGLNSPRRGGPDDEIVYRTSPGLDAIFHREDLGQLSLGYAPTLLMYGKNPKLNTVEHRIRARGDATLGSLTIRSAGSATWSVATADPTFTGYIRNFRGDASLDLEYQFTELFGVLGEVGATYAQSFPRTLAPIANVAEWTNDYFVTISPNVSEKLKILVGGGWREWHYYNKNAEQPDVTLGHLGGGVIFILGDLLELDGRGFYEFGGIKKQNTNADIAIAQAVALQAAGTTVVRRRFVPSSFLGNGSATLHLGERFDFRVFGSSRMAPHARAAFQWLHTGGASFVARLPRNVEASLTASILNQNPRKSPELYLETYLLKVDWFVLENLEIGAQVGFSNAHIRTPGFSYEVFHGGIGITVKL